ncbi:hypothetical protein HYH03_013726 [Edaphochlamys debaryana]|uniref:Uncharacterized protein n=1 Tax=Edaphochlamys debaryana TaxID=47281 RepID=A0A835XMS4_9CHLO|nr:hypothetical protein HYH03_013726 [Edaphochlamys debaryana]|eukprot:KAG2487727.1 hypothetical protein HYH03_013726 [Edaphochlamys debaryana]
MLLVPAPAAGQLSPPRPPPMPVGRSCPGMPYDCMTLQTSYAIDNATFTYSAGGLGACSGNLSGPPVMTYCQQGPPAKPWDKSAWCSTNVRNNVTATVWFDQALWAWEVGVFVVDCQPTTKSTAQSNAPQSEASKPAPTKPTAQPTAAEPAPAIASSTESPAPEPTSFTSPSAAITAEPTPAVACSSKPRSAKSAASVTTAKTPSAQP